MKLDYSHVEYVLHCLEGNTSKSRISRNIYLLRYSMLLQRLVDIIGQK